MSDIPAFLNAPVDEHNGEVQPASDVETEPTPGFKERPSWRRRGVMADALTDDEAPDIDPEVEARRAGYSWPEINAHIADSTAKALSVGYTPAEIDQHLGRPDPTAFQDRARATWAGAQAADTALLDTADLTASPTFRSDYAAALQDGEVQGPQDFADQYAAASLQAAHDVHGEDDSNMQGVRDKQAQAGMAAGTAAAELPTKEDLIDAAVALTPVGPTKRTQANLLDHWLTTGQDPVSAAMQADSDPELADKLTTVPPQEPAYSLATLTDPMVEFAKGYGGQIASDLLSVGRIRNGVEKWLGDALGLPSVDKELADELTSIAKAEADTAALFEPNQKDVSTFVGRNLGGAAGAATEFFTLGLWPTAAMWALHGADVAYRETNNLAAAAMGATLQGAAAFIPFHLLQGEGGIVANAVKGVAAMGAMGGLQVLADPLPGLVAGHGYEPPTLAQVAEGVAAGGVGGALFGVLGAVKPIRTYDPAASFADAVQSMTPEKVIEQAAEQSPYHEAAARYATMDPAERGAALDRDYAPAAEGETKPEGPTPEEERAHVEELIPSYEGAHDMLRYFKGLSSDMLKDVSGALNLYHGTGVVFASELGAPFGRFKLEKVGAGEGRQLYSWGLYFAQDPKIAGWYEDTDLKRKGTDEGSLFTVKIDVEPHQLLDWDVPLSEQPEQVQDAAVKALGQWAVDHPDEPMGMTGERVFKRIMQEKGAATSEVTRMIGPYNRATSMALLAEGIKGMRYTDASTRGLPVDERSFNHVIYDARDIKITHRNGQEVPNSLFSLLMPLLEGSGIGRVGAAVEAMSAKFPLRTPEQIVRHHLNEAARDSAQMDIIRNVGRGERTLADFGSSLEQFQKLFSPHMTEWEQALAGKDPAKMQNTVIGNFIAYVEGVSNGATLRDSTLKPVADMMRIINSEMYEKLANSPNLNAPGYVEDYFRHLWKDPRGPEWEALRGQFKGVGKTGSSQGLQERSIPTTMDGLAAGMVPKIANPIDLMMHDLGQKVRYLHAQEIRAFGKEQGNIYTAASARDPNDVQLRNSTRPVGENQNVFDWAPKGFAKSYNNWLDAGLYGTPATATAYEKLLWMTNTMTGLKLAWPTFHAGVVAMGSWGGTFGRAMEEVARGQLGRAALDFTSAASVAGPIITDAVKGTKVIRDYANMVNDPTLSLLTDAGLRFGPRQSVYRFGPESLQKTAARGGGLFTAGGMREIFRGLSKDFTDIAGDADTEAAGRRLLRVPDRAIQWPIKTLGRVMNTITDPLFDHMIPALKVGSAYSRLESWLDANKMASPEAKLAKAREVAKDVDNRLGELNQDTLFWRKSVKQSANLTLISTGWVYGTYRGTFGALGVDIEHGKFAWNPTSTAATIGTVVGFMYANSIMQYLKTGTTPLQTDTPLADMLNYRTGAANKWGSPERGMIGSEIKEAYDLFKAVTWAIGTGSYSQLGPAFNSYIAAKVNPFWQMLNTLRTGEDGIGHKVAFTPDGWFGKNGYMRQLFSPIVVDQLLHGRVGSEVGLFEKLMGIREAAHQVEDFDSYMKGVGGLAARWTKEELSRARKEALANGEEPPEGSVSTRGGGASAPRVSNRAGGYAPQQPSPRQNPSFYGYAPQPQQPVAGQPSVERSAAGPMILRGAGRRPTTRRRAR